MYIIDEKGNVLHGDSVTKVDIEKFESFLGVVIPSKDRRSGSVGSISNIFRIDFEKNFKKKL